MNAKGKHEGFKPVFRHLTGGLDIAASWGGIETALFCEIEPYAVQILKRRWPDVPILPDVREIDGRDWSVDVVHGGFPCQDLSVAGKQAGLSGERSGLWFEMLRVISECRPRYVVAENVRGAVALALDTVCSGLGDEGYEVRALVLPASAFGAPHQRERLFVVGVRADVADSLRSRGEARLPGPLQGEEGDAAIPLDDGAPSGSLWPTPLRSCSSGAGAHGDGGLNLQTAVKAQLWPTPLSQDAKHGSISPAQAGKNLLTNAVLEGALWPTPVGSERSGINPKTGKGAGLSKVNGGQLNPIWVECLMGYPLGWTDVDCDEPEPWPGWPALMGEKLWKTPAGQEPGINPERLTGDLGHRMYDKDTGRHAQYGVSQQVKIIESAQYPYEPPRTVVGCKNRAKRLKCLGNSVVPQQAYPIFRAIAEMEAMAP